MNPKTLQPFKDAFRLRLNLENELKSSEIDVTAWHIGLYVRSAIASVFNRSATYPTSPLSLTQTNEEQMTGRDHADRFREFLKHYKRPPVKGGEK